MTGDIRTAHNGAEVPNRDKRQRIRAGSIALSSGSPHTGNLQWSELGQALVVTDDYIVILSPLTGLHPTLAAQSRTQDVECHPDWNDRFPHSVTEINVKTFLDNQSTKRRRTLLESDHSAVDPRFQNVQWSSACWSKPGLGPHASCLILATTSELDLFVLGAPFNAWTGEWKLLQVISLDLIAEVTEADAARSSGEKEVFSQSRALLRKMQMSTEVTCASFVDLAGPSRGNAESDHSPTYVIAGLRSGYIGVWNCEPITGDCFFVQAVSASSTSIEKFTLSSDVGECQTGLLARIAVKHADGVILYGLYATDGSAQVRLETVSPIHSERGMITAWCWLKDKLVYATISRVHVYHCTTEQTRTFSVGTGPFDSLDPFSPVIDIRPSSDASSEVKVVLLDLREYTISLSPPDEADPEPEAVEPTLPPTLTGYSPMTERLQRKHNDLQAFLGYAVEPSSRLSSASLVGAVRTDQKVAFLGYNSSDALCYQLEVVRSGSVVAASLLDEALESTASGTPPYLTSRIVLSLMYTSKQQNKLRDQLVSAIEDKWTALATVSADSHHPQQQLLYLLAIRLQESASDSSAPFSTLISLYRESVLRNWLRRWLADLTRLQKAGQATVQDGKTLSMLSAASRLLPRANVEATAPSVKTDEQCAACNTQLVLTWNEQHRYFGWAKCQKGHVWPRCSLSLETISDREVRVCIGCWAKAILPDECESSRLLDMLQSNCLYCGSHWIVR
ncbi:hypothetical protein EX895_005385 [Sporisorium graminicola]|uniref:Transcription factor IIIC 90kDa subunit N-terminal domain-containing protein n=1 Tax=Sporisorium graminicola TaxID=280036 RepID=A0A4U7KNJ8_9BASI|nr:hypothetical protein EX895_005385 [Sporisorium graminicola]TKY85844.1 hypothetical protein EX895_005385 [Sporisorium graminicola]